MLGDVEVADAEREIDRVEIFERRGKKRQVQRDEREGERKPAGARRSELNPPSRLLVIDVRLGDARRLRDEARQVGRRSSPSFRLPMR